MMAIKNEQVGDLFLVFYLRFFLFFVFFRKENFNL